MIFGLGKKDDAVKEDEQILGYDKDNLSEYRKCQEAEELLAHANDKGFRKPSHKQIERAKETVQDYRRKKAQTFLEEHKKRITYYGVEIQAHFEQLGNGLLKPSLRIADFDPFKPLRNMKPWGEALEENLATRINCTHEMNDDETACKHCALNPENWGENNEGVTNEYQDKQRKRIAEEKEHELACKRGEHKLNDEAEKDPDAPMRFCVYCRKPEDQWVKPTEQTAGSPAAAE